MTGVHFHKRFWVVSRSRDAGRPGIWHRANTTSFLLEFRSDRIRKKRSTTLRGLQDKTFGLTVFEGLPKIHGTDRFSHGITCLSHTSSRLRRSHALETIFHLGQVTRCTKGTHVHGVQERGPVQPARRQAAQGVLGQPYSRSATDSPCGPI